jgi:hypothetical protein
VLATDVALGGLNADVAEQELNLVEFSTRLTANEGQPMSPIAVIFLENGSKMCCTPTSHHSSVLFTNMGTPYVTS